MILKKEKTQAFLETFDSQKENAIKTVSELKNGNVILVKGKTLSAVFIKSSEKILGGIPYDSNADNAEIGNAIGKLVFLVCFAKVDMSLSEEEFIGLLTQTEYIVSDMIFVQEDLLEEAA